MIIKIIVAWVKNNIRFAFSETPSGKILFTCNIPGVEGYVIIYISTFVIGCIKI